MLTHTEIIDAKEGPVAFAEKIGATVNEVRVWRARNKIPRTRWLEVHAVFPDLDLPTLQGALTGPENKPDRAP